jgi:hypothetical protein
VNQSKERKRAACGDGIDLNSIHNDRQRKEIAKKSEYAEVRDEEKEGCKKRRGGNNRL